MKQNPVVHFEIPGENKERMKKFYADAFGWEYNQLGEEMNNYTVVMTTESDNTGPLKKGIINGGFYDKSDFLAKAPSLVISVDDISAHMKVVTDAGGTVHGEPVAIPGVGMHVAFTDTEGNILSMLQPEGVM